MARAKKEPGRCKYLVHKPGTPADSGKTQRCKRPAENDGACKQCRLLHPMTGAKTKSGKARAAASLRKHGIYSKFYTDEERAALPDIIGNTQDLEPEIARTRIALRRFHSLVQEITAGEIGTDDPWHEGKQEAEVITRETEGGKDKNGKPLPPKKNTYTKRKTSKNMPSLEALYNLIDRYTKTLANMEMRLFEMRQSRPPDDEADFARKVKKLIQDGTERTGGDGGETEE